MKPFRIHPLDYRLWHLLQDGLDQCVLIFHKKKHLTFNPLDPLKQTFNL